MEITQELMDSLAISEMDIMHKISDVLNIELRQVVPTVNLLNEGCTVPFISRYRKKLQVHLMRFKYVIYLIVLQHSEILKNAE